MKTKTNSPSISLKEIQPRNIKIPAFLVFTIILLGCRSALAQLSPAQLHIDRPDTGPVRIELLGEVGRDYTIEAADELGTNGWSPLFSFSLPSDTQSFFDPASPSLPRRFYRAVTHDGPAPVERGSNFRLIDQLGKSRELNYHWTDTNVAAFVLVFTANGCAAVRDLVAALNALRSQFEPQRIRFWMINSDPSDSRSNIVAEATALGLTLPVLHDRAQLVARSYHISTAPEALLVVRGESLHEWSILYRGALDDRAGSAASTRPYLAEALAGFVASGVVEVKRTPTAGCTVSLAPVPPVSYATDIAPLLQAKCVRCHSPGNIAPWSMTNYDIVQESLGQIRDNVLSAHMPPWHADPEYGVFTNDFSLGPEEARKLVQWIDDGAPRGQGPDPLAGATTPLEYPFAWPAELGEPDAVLTFPLQTIAATGIEPYRYPTMTSPFPSNVWLRAVVVLPSNPRAAHHEVSSIGNSDDALGSYNPGQGPWIYPPGTRRLLPQGATITISLHYVTSGTPQTDQPRIGFYLAGNDRPLAIQRLLIGWADEGAGIYPPIRPYVQEDVRTTTYTFGSDAYLFQLSPHMHLRGSRMAYEAIYPSGFREVLLSVPQFHAHWQTMYRFVQPKRVPSGTMLRITGAFDNSPQSEHNPAPSQLVNWGPQLQDEMFLGGIHFAETLTVRTQPRSQNVSRGGQANFSVSATSPNGPIRYQWRLNGSALVGATNSSFIITNAQPIHEGAYSVAVSDQAETLTSQSALLAVGDGPVITQHPQSQTAHAGDTVTFRVTATGTLPLSYRWRKDNVTLLTTTNNDTTATLTLTNVQTINAGTYSVGVFNLFGNAPVSSNAVLTVLTP